MMRIDLERCCWSRGSSILRHSMRTTNQHFLSSQSHLTVKSYDRIVKDSSCVHWKSEEHNSDRWLAFQNQKEMNGQTMPQPDPCRQLRVPECLVKADSCGCGTEESRTVKGASWVHGICMQVHTVWDITFTFLPKPTAQENGVLKFPDLREEDAVLDSGAECAHT